MNTGRPSSRGAAVVDFVLVLTVLVPLFLGVLQVGLVLMVRNTLASAAAARFADDVDATTVALDGQPAVRVTVRATVPALGLGGPGVAIAVQGHAVEETP